LFQRLAISPNAQLDVRRTPSQILHVFRGTIFVPRTQAFLANFARLDYGQPNRVKFPASFQRFVKLARAENSSDRQGLVKARLEVAILQSMMKIGAQRFASAMEVLIQTAASTALSGVPGAIALCDERPGGRIVWCLTQVREKGLDAFARFREVA
jgi:hypothetical protein